MTIGYLVVGHITIDHLADQMEMTGGPAFYSSLTASNLGARVSLHTSCASDVDLNHLLPGISVSRVHSSDTTAFHVLYQADGSRTQRILRTAAPLLVGQLPTGWPEPGILQLAPECGEIEGAFASAFPEAMLCLTPQGWLREWDSSGVIRPGRWAGPDLPWDRVDAVVLSEEDMDPFAVRELAERVRLLVVTRAARGSDVFRRGRPDPYHALAFAPDRECDPTGAGDVFAAAYFLGLFAGRDPDSCADWANCVASFAVEGLGASGIPTRDAVDRRWARGRRL